MNRTYKLTDAGWVRVEMGMFGTPHEWPTGFVPSEVSDCAARTGARRISWDGRNAIPLDVPRVRVVVERHDTPPPRVVIERRVERREVGGKEVLGAAAGAAIGSLLGSLIGGRKKPQPQAEPEPERKRSRRGRRGR